MSHERIIAQIEALPANPSEVDQIAAVLIEDVLQGNSEALPLLLRLKSWERLYETVAKEIKGIAAKELAARGADKEMHGYRMALTSSVTYDYSKNDRWCILKSNENAYAEQRKALEAELKRFADLGEVAETATGEVHAAAAVKSSKQGVSFTPLDRPIV